MIREYPQDPKTLFFAWGPRRASINGACGINQNHTQTLATRSHSCLPSHLPPKNAIPLPLGFCAVQMAGALSCSASRFPISARAHIPPPLCALLQPLGKRPILALIGLPATKYFCGARTDDGLVRSVSSQFDYWASESNRMPMSLYVSNADQANK